MSSESEMVSVPRELLSDAVRLLSAHDGGGWSEEHFCAKDLRAILAQPVSLDDRADADGSCPHCSVELDLEEYLRAVLARPAQAEQQPIDGNMKLPCEVRLPGGMTIGKGCALSTLLLALRNRDDSMPWRQRFGVPMPFDPRLRNLIAALSAQGGE